MHCSVPPLILSNQLQSNGLERNSARLIYEFGFNDLPTIQTSDHRREMGSRDALGLFVIGRRYIR